MSDDRTWSDQIADAAKGACLGVGAAGIIAGSPAVALNDASLQFSDPVIDSAISAIADSHEALSAITEGRKDSDDIVDATDIRWEPTTSLTVDTPSWVSDPLSADATLGTDLAWDGSPSDLSGADAGDTAGGLL